MNAVEISAMRSARRTQAGVTLVELMVAMVLGLVIMGSAVQVFMANKQSFRTSTALARLQENGRFAMQSIARDLRMAGYVGCTSRQMLEVNTVANNSPPTIDLTQAVLGFDDASGWWTAGTPPTEPGGASLTLCDSTGGGNATCQVSDVIQFGRGSAFAAPISEDMANGSAAIKIRKSAFDDFDPPLVVNGSAPTAEDLVLITDCRRSDLFRATGVSTTGQVTTITQNAALQQGYRQGAMVMPIVAASYFVADDGFDDDGDGNADPVAELYRLGLTDGGTIPAAVPIAEGVEAMNVLYGVDSTGDDFADQYMTAAQVSAAGSPDWSDVVSVRISLLLKSKDDLVTDSPVPVTFVDGSVVNSGTGADRRLRMVFSQTVGLRNRVP